MSSKLLWAASILAIVSGCAIPPPPPDPVSVPRSTAEDDGDGWLFDQLTGRERPKPTANPTTVPNEAPPYDVVQTSAAEPIRPRDIEPALAEEEEEADGFDLEDLDPFNMYQNVKTAAGYGPNEGIAKGYMKEGEALFAEAKALHETAQTHLTAGNTDEAAKATKAAKAKFAEAAKKFKSAAGRWPDSLLEEDAMFLAAECQYFSDSYGKAQDSYDLLLTKYDNTRYLDTVTKRLFSIGQYWLKLHKNNPRWPVTPNFTDAKLPTFDTFGNAIKAFESVRMHDPTGPLADDAIMAIATAYFAGGKWEDAAYHYELLRTEHPTSEHQAKAHQLGLEATMRVYQGSLYDKTPLEKADKIATQALKQFPRELGADRTEIERVKATILAERAQRDFTVAEYYDKRSQYGSARMIYSGIIKKYPGTPHAERAAKRMEEIKDKPDNPPNRFEWFTNLFPDD